MTIFKFKVLIVIFGVKSFFDFQMLCLAILFRIYVAITVKFLNFGTPEMFAVLYLKFKQRGQILRYSVKMVQMVANSEDPHQTAPLRAV